MSRAGTRAGTPSVLEELTLEPVLESMEGLCLDMRLVRLQHLVALPRNNRYAILLGEARDGSYRVAIPGDAVIFGLKSKNIDFLPQLKGYNMCENIKTLKRHPIDVETAWKDIYIDPNSTYTMGEFLGVGPDEICGVREKISDRFLFGEQESASLVVFGLADTATMEKLSLTLHTTMLSMCWGRNDMPYRDLSPSSKTPLKSYSEFCKSRACIREFEERFRSVQR